MLAEVEQLLGRRSSKPVRGHSTFDFGRQSQFSFTREVCEFCPDIVDLGAGTVDGLEAGIRELRLVLLGGD